MRVVYLLVEEVEEEAVPRGLEPAREVEQEREDAHLASITTRIHHQPRDRGMAVYK
jgi:hypothetical protein